MLRKRSNLLVGHRPFSNQKQAMSEKRDKLGKGLSAEQLKKAEQLAQEWMKKGK